jgi:hypothetical protein
MTVNLASQLKIRKTIRAKVIWAAARDLGIRTVVCCSCGNATAALRETQPIGRYVVDISPNGQIRPNKWLEPADIARIFPGHLDATPGHLPLWVLRNYGEALIRNVDLSNVATTVIPCGSGEALVALKMVRPWMGLCAEYDDRRPELKYDPECLLNSLVEELSEEVIRLGC